MLRESSATTATMFCCGRSVATLSAGCQSITEAWRAMAVCSNQIATASGAESPDRGPGPETMAMRTRRRREQERDKHPHGQRPRSTIWPFENAVRRIFKEKLEHVDRACLMRHRIDDVVDSDP